MLLYRFLDNGNIIITVTTSAVMALAAALDPLNSPLGMYPWYLLLALLCLIFLLDFGLTS